MKRRIGSLFVQPIGLGCMNLSHAYGDPPPREVAAALLHLALDLGIDLFDTAALYGFGGNEALLGEVLAPHRQRFVLATKCGLQGVDGRRVIDGRPATLRQSVENSLHRLKTDVIDLLYLHRWDKQVPIEDSVGALADLVRQGKVRELGLSEVSSATLRRAHAVHPIAALQSEYSLWSRDVERGVLETCRELGVALVAFSPLGRGFLAGSVTSADGLAAKDLRRSLPRFTPQALAANRAGLQAFDALAQEIGLTSAQLALAWVVGRDQRVIAIPGSTNAAHVKDNWQARGLHLSAEHAARAERAFADVFGARYPDATFAEIDFD